ncbi:MAG: ATP-binding response regulator, partial [Rhodospirillales bacterium]
VGRSFNTMADQISAREAALAQAKARLEQAVEERTAELKRVLDQLRVHEENRRRLLADVSHELRTPLTIIQGEADIALRGREKTPDVYREALEKSREAAKHTARLVDDLLFVARREAGEARLRCEAVDLARLLPEVIDDHRALAGGRGGGIAFTSAVETATVRADGDRIRQVVVILMDNALRYGDGRIEVALHGAPGGFAVSVTDVGPGMTEEEQERAFERFFRGSDAAHRYREGSGLGLPVAKAIVEAHGGQIALRSSPDQGTRVTFTVPVRPKLEDEARVADFIQRGLRTEGYAVTVARDGEAAVGLLDGHAFDVVILDLMLPGISGQVVCQRMRAANNTTPVLMLTALDAVDDRVAGLRLGADDYLVKPFDFDELLARIEALCRRGARANLGEGRDEILEAGDLRFDTRSLQVTCCGQPIELSAKERDILKLLMADAGRVFSRERILNAIWSVSEDPLTNIVDVYIGRLRKKLGPCGETIKTIRGAGYRLAACSA